MYVRRPALGLNGPDNDFMRRLAVDETARARADRCGLAEEVQFTLQCHLGESGVLISVVADALTTKSCENRRAVNSAFRTGGRWEQLGSRPGA
jgi:hypothetical protein